jgi:hypothetical protein
VIWARSDEAAMLILEKHGCHSALLRRTSWQSPEEGDLVVYDEEEKSW